MTSVQQHQKCNVVKTRRLSQLNSTTTMIETKEPILRQMSK